jgi:hypothetical protein
VCIILKACSATPPEIETIRGSPPRSPNIAHPDGVIAAPARREDRQLRHTALSRAAFEVANRQKAWLRNHVTATPRVHFRYMDESAFLAHETEISSEHTRQYREAVRLAAIHSELDSDKQTLASSRKAIVRSRATLNRCIAWPGFLGEPD